MSKLIVIPILLPWIASIVVAQKKIVSEKNLKPVVGFTVFINFITFFVVAQMMPGVRLHILTINNFLDLYLRPDSMGILFGMMVSLLWILTTFYAFEYMKKEGRIRQFYTFFLFTLGVTVGIAFSGNLFTLYAFYEFLTIATFPLVIHSGTEEALKSGQKYIIYSFSGAAFVLMGMILVYSKTNALHFIPKGIITTDVFSIMNQNEQKLLLIGYLFLFIGFGVKAALAPFHGWLPGAMVAPTPVSALLHAVAVVKSGIFSLIRVTYYLFGAACVKWLGASRYLLPFILITIIMGSLLAIHNDNLKKRLAYSTISQLGYIILGIALLNQEAFIGALLHMINHAVIKITLFFVAGSIACQTGLKYVHQLNGVGKRMKTSMMCFAAASISLIGLPPTNGFISKWFLALGALREDNFLYAVILLLSAFLTAAYLLPVLISAFFSKRENPVLDEIPEGSLEPSDMMLKPILILTALIILLGVFPNPLIDIVTHIAEEVL